LKKDYPFTPLPAPPYRPILGIFLAVIGKATVPIFFIGWFLYFFLVWIPVIGTEGSDHEAAKFFFGFIYIVAFFLVRPFLSRLVERGNALRQTDAISYLEEDPRPPILYLRSFDDDDLADSTVSSGLIPVINTYELRLKKALVDLGPMISIGRPGEALPKIGSARFYVSNDEWQSAMQFFLPDLLPAVIDRRADAFWSRDLD
jgi:hypothetical protein